MRRILILLTMLLAGVGGALAQSQALSTLMGFEKKLAKSDKEIEHPKKSLKEGTWLDRADLLMELQTAYQMNSYSGVDLPTMQLLAGPPTGQREATEDGQTYLVYETPYVDFYFLNGNMSFYRVTKPIVEGPLARALEALNKATELDVKGKKAKAISGGLVKLKTLHINEGVNCYTQGDFTHAVEHFDRALAIAQMPQVQAVDTAIYYYRGMACYHAKQYGEAAKSFARAIELGYELDGTTYCLYYETCQADGRPADGKEYLLRGMEKFPEQQCLVLDLINYHVSQNEDPSLVLPYLEKALANDPDNAVLYFVKGVVYDQLKRPAESIAAYEVAVQKNPAFVDAYYNMAALHYNLGVGFLNEAVELPASKTKEYDELMVRVNEEFHLSIPPAEKVLTIDENHAATLDLLKSIYFRYRAEPGMQEKHDAVAKKLEALGK